MPFSNPNKTVGKQRMTNLPYASAPRFSIHPFCVTLLCIIASTLQCTSIANGQEASVAGLPPCEEVAVKVDSGLVGNASDRREVAWSETVKIKGAKWLQLQFGDVILTKGIKQESTLKITSLEDGAVQILNAKCFKEWREKSAFFNGDAVKVELLAHPGAEKNCVVVNAVTAGTANNSSAPESICDLVDDRRVSNDRRIGRIDIGCTAWLFDDRSNDLITAGHCAASMTVVFFNVPLSDADGTINFPSPDDQYAICTDSLQFVNGGVGNDWCYFGVFDNSNTGLSPLAAQGDSFTIGTPDSNTFGPGNSVRITGYGTTSAPINPRWNQAQKTHFAPFDSLVGNTLSYRPDTTGGNSGSPVIGTFSNIAYGVHTHGGCGNGGGTNFGTGLNHPNFQAAINSPLGACNSPNAPPNDACRNAISIGDGTRDYDTSFATTDGPALPAACEEGAGLSFVRDIWFQYTAECTGQATFDFCESSYDTRVAAYSIDTTTDDRCPGDLLECNDDSCGLQSELRLDVVAGEEYLIRVGGFSGGGLGTMTITCLSDDDCSAYVDVTDGVMVVNATQGQDQIIITQTSNMLQVSINSECSETFSLRDIDQIVINGFGGADWIQVDAFVTTLIDAGSGADIVFGGSLAADILGGPGTDLIFGGPADDRINAGFGEDTVFGLAGDDEIIGGAADDMLDGGAGNDELFGGLGGDTILGGTGNDLLVGSVGADMLNAGAGDDELIGLGGPDEMLGGPGNDVFTGGAGFDTMDGGGGTDSAMDTGEVEIRIEN